MSIQFRPSVGPFVRVPDQREGSGFITKLLVLPILLTIVWPLQLVWLAIKWSALGVVFVVRWVHAQLVMQRNVRWAQNQERARQEMQWAAGAPADPDLQRSAR
jgi:hypothetical protein